jgi:hypothetical protein
MSWIPSRRTLLGGAALGVALTPIGYMVAGLAGVHGSSARVLTGLCFGVGTSTVFLVMVRTVVEAVTRGFESTLPINRPETSRPIPLSPALSAAARGDHETATRVFDELIAEHGADAVLCRAAVNYHMNGGGDATRAESILRWMRQQSAEHEHFATQRLVDLYVGALADRGRALVELRRLADRFPGTPEGDGALRAIGELREQQSRRTTADDHDHS